MAKVPFRFSFFQKCWDIFSFYFSSWFFVGGFFFRWQFDKNASEKRIAVSSFAVLQCEIPINWADELVCIGFLFFSHRCSFLSFSFCQRFKMLSIRILFSSLLVRSCTLFARSLSLFHFVAGFVANIHGIARLFARYTHIYVYNFPHRFFNRCMDNGLLDGYFMQTRALYHWN